MPYTKIILQPVTFLCLCLCGQFLAAATHQVGFASLDITPSKAFIAEGKTFMGGYGVWTARGPAKSVHDPLGASAICLSDTQENLCIVMLDSLGLPAHITQRIAEKISQITALSADSIFIGASHTHAAPDLIGLWGGVPDSYTDYLVNQASRAVAEAYLNREPANLFYSLAQGQAYNRRGWGFTDDTITVIEALAENGTQLGTVINFAAHPVVSRETNLGISSDYVHYLRLKMQNLTDAPTIFINGAIGDVVPMQHRPLNEWRAAQEYGETIANAAFNALIGRKQIMPGISIAHATFRTEVDNTVLALAHSLGIISAKSEGPPWSMTVESRVGVFSLGQQVQAVAVPGEAMTRLGRTIKLDMQAPAKLFLGLTGGSLGYFIPADEWQSDRNDNYEESVSMGKHIAAQIHTQLRRMQSRQNPISDSKN